MSALDLLKAANLTHTVDVEGAEVVYTYNPLPAAYSQYTQQLVLSAVDGGVMARTARGTATDADKEGLEISSISIMTEKGSEIKWFAMLLCLRSIEVVPTDGKPEVIKMDFDVVDVAGRKVKAVKAAFIDQLAEDYPLLERGLLELCDIVLAGKEATAEEKKPLNPS